MLSALSHAQALSFFSHSFLCLSTSPKTARSAPAMSASVVRIVIVGDVHDDWDLQEDSKALQLLKPDLVLFTGMFSSPFLFINLILLGACIFVFFSDGFILFAPMPLGDFGNENVEIVQSVAELEFPKAVILGNHDSWKTQEFSGNLGEEHVAYRRLDFPTLKLSIVGGRPFSCGGQQIFRKRLLSARYGVQDMDESAKRIYKVALGTPDDHLVILLAHNGPSGLGSEPNDICGKDWGFGGGDHGDPDLAQAISLLKETTKLCIPLVVFGHMHKELAYGNGLRKMIVVGADSTIYLNGAIVPRVKRLIDEQGTDSSSVSNKTSFSRPDSKGTIRAFTVVEILDGRIDKIAERWIIVVGDTTTLQEEHILFKYSS
ncbi:calcineurin-like metallo-phosphoesterase superfamily protein [Citrus sinensis]|uniref:Calcineurin-like metallo-phosphoesterase superfamily protein n=1 Tax=Citrus sinensis TaxID=2711 RepID=A0ACB8P7G5_CITSI|nr:calcineurin-like metallo-phosphoesterase superfamily protein [Citrus sinensis]